MQHAPTESSGLLLLDTNILSPEKLAEHGSWRGATLVTASTSAREVLHAAARARRRHVVSPRTINVVACECPPHDIDPNLLGAVAQPIPGPGSTMLSLPCLWRYGHYRPASSKSAVARGGGQVMSYRKRLGWFTLVDVSTCSVLT